MLMLRFCWCYTTHISTQQPPGTRYASCDEDGGVGWGGVITSVAFPHELDATLHDLHLHFIISTWTWCYVAATLYDRHLHFYMNLMYALWSSFALSLSSLALHTTLFEFLRKMFNMNMLRSMTMLRNMKMLRHMNMLRSMTMLRNMTMPRNMKMLRNMKNRGKVKIHTGHVDGFWKVLKQTIPGSLPSKKCQARNPQIWKCMRSFQWRWECTGKNLMEATADALKKMWEKVAVALFEAEVMEVLSFQK